MNKWKQDEGFLGSGFSDVVVVIPSRHWCTRAQIYRYEESRKFDNSNQTLMLTKEM